MSNRRIWVIEKRSKNPKSKWELILGTATTISRQGALDTATMWNRGYGNREFRVVEYLRVVK